MLCTVIFGTLSFPMGTSAWNNLRTNIPFSSVNVVMTDGLRNAAIVTQKKYGSHTTAAKSVQMLLNGHPTRNKAWSKNPA